MVFNNKGGVGKTTLVCNLAAFLSIRKNKKVLVVDTDPQCNATAYMFPYPQIEELYTKPQDTIYEVISPVQKGKGYFSGELPILTSENFKVDVLIGDPRLSLTEDFLSTDWLHGRSGEYRGLQTSLVFRELLSRVGDYDYVFFDVGPSLGALNRAVLLASEFFVVPMSSDIFSLRALENISVALKTWKDELTRGLADYKKKEADGFTIGNSPVEWRLQFAGYVTQQYTAKTTEGKKQPVKAYETIIKKIPHAITKHLVPLNSSTLSADRIGEIQSLHSLVPLSQNSSVPIFDLKGSHGVVGAHFAKVKEYEKTIGSVARQLQANLLALE